MRRAREIWSGAITYDLGARLRDSKMTRFPTIEKTTDGELAIDTASLLVLCLLTRKRAQEFGSRDGSTVALEECLFSSVPSHTFHFAWFSLDGDTRLTSIPNRPPTRLLSWPFPFECIYLPFRHVNSLTRNQISNSLGHSFA